MKELTLIQRAIIEEISDEPVNKRIIKRIVKVKEECFDVNYQAFDSQIDTLTDMGLIKQDDINNVLLTEEGHYLCERYSIVY
jgi:predicted transcriptional regulator